MKSEVKAYVNLKRFEDHSSVEMEGMANHIIWLAAMLVDEIAKKTDESPQNILREINSRIIQTRILKVLKGDRS